MLALGSAQEVIEEQIKVGLYIRVFLDVKSWKKSSRSESLM
jgi:hypothetical protein